MDTGNMRFFHITDKPLKIYGLVVADKEKRNFWRLPGELMDKFPKYDFLGKRACGGRVRFASDTHNLTVRMTLAQSKEDINIPLSGSAGADVYLGRGRESVYCGYIAPNVHMMQEITTEKNFELSGEMQIITINLPRNDHLLSMEIGIDHDAQIQEAPDYAIQKPIVFYGSSITEGGCASRAGNAYTSIVCRWLDADYKNLGFSGSARGEKIIAEYIASIPDMSLFVYDYDHNAQSVEELEDTHAGFFQIIREKNPQLPILMMSRPDVDKNREESARRRDVIRQTYVNAREGGDERVYFLDGHTFFGEMGREECTVDGTHPNALGFMRMAECIYPMIQKILG